MKEETSIASEHSGPTRSGWVSLLSVAGFRYRLFGGVVGNVFRGMATLALGAGAARVIGVIAIPFLTRIYSPEDFGLLAVFTALVAMLVPIVTLRYVVAVPLPRHNGMAMNLVVLSTGLLSVIVFAVGLVLFVAGPSLLTLMSMEALAPWWWLIVFGLVGTGLYEILSMWATRQQAYGVVARTQILQGVVGSALKILLGLLSLKPLGLLLGQIAAQCGGIGMLSRSLWPEFRANMRFVTPSRLRLAAGRYKGFPIYRLPTQFLAAFSMQSPILFSAMIFSKEEVGNLSLALSLTALPIAIFGTSLGQAFYSDAAKLGQRNSKAIYELSKNTCIRLAFLSAIPALAIFFLSPIVFGALFGGAWSLSGDLAGYLSIYLAMQFVSSPMSNIVNIYNLQHYSLILNIVRCALVAFVFLSSHFMSLDIRITILVYSIMLLVYYSLYAYVLLSIPRKLSGQPWRGGGVRGVCGG